MIRAKRILYVLGTCAALAVGAFLLFSAWRHFSYQRGFTRAYEAHVSVQNAKSADLRRNVQREYEALLRRDGAIAWRIHYNMALIAYARGMDEAGGYGTPRGIEDGIILLQEALRETTDPMQRADIFYALAWGAGQRVVESPDYTSDAKRDQLFLLAQALRENPNHWAAKRLYDLLKREWNRQNQQGQGNGNGKQKKPQPQERKESGPGFVPGKPKP